jgi:glucosamine--fructose-6-phosphate aminotransferase (isomerizing)
VCGVLGYVGDRQATPILLQALRNIAYRGYDSCGLTVDDTTSDVLTTFRAVGSPDRLTELVNGNGSGTFGLAHTRWATHGEPTDHNAHPHSDCTGKLAVVHNGIIENFMPLRDELVARGHTFRSDTDTEVIAHLIEEEIASGAQLEEAVRHATARLEGSYAFVVMSKADPGRLVGARLDCPLLIASDQNGQRFFTSDIAAVMDICSEMLVVSDGQVASITPHETTLTDVAGNELEQQFEPIDGDRELAERGGFPHFMLKEIFDQPKSVKELLRERLSPGGVTRLPELDEVLPDDIEQVVLMACGTASYACAFGKVIIEELTGLPVLAEAGSEFRYRRQFLDSKSLFVAISQSGETADTIASLRAAREAGAPVLGVVNVVGTTIAREADAVIYSRGGPECAVPSTKVFMNQLLSVALIGLHLAYRRGETDAAAQLGQQLLRLPAKIEEALELAAEMRTLAERFAGYQNWFVIGRGLDEALAREAALKLKEVAYIHAEAIAAGELKHGPIALIDEDMPVLAFVSQPQVQSKMANNLQEVAARRGQVVVFSTIGDAAIDAAATSVTRIPTISPYVDPMLLAVPLQLLSYYCGIQRGTNIDYPRNLAKSVTVE